MLAYAVIATSTWATAAAPVETGKEVLAVLLQIAMATVVRAQRVYVGALRVPRGRWHHSDRV